MRRNAPRAALRSGALQLTGVLVRQCYRCYSFGHVAKMCAAKAVRCGYCSSTHKETECQAKKDDLEEVMFGGSHTARTRYINYAEKHPV